MYHVLVLFCHAMVTPHRFSKVGRILFCCLLLYYWIVILIYSSIRVTYSYLNDGDNIKVTFFKVANYDLWKEKNEGLVLWGICIFLFLVHRSWILCLVKNEILNTNEYVVLLVILWMTMYKILLFIRQMREPYEINSNQYMPLNQEATNFTYCFFFCRIEVQGKDINRENQSNFQGRFD